MRAEALSRPYSALTGLFARHPDYIDKLGGNAPPNPSPSVQATALAPTAVRAMRNAPTDVCPTMHKAAADVHAMQAVDSVVAKARVGIEVVMSIAAVPPTPAAKMMPPSRPA